MIDYYKALFCARCCTVQDEEWNCETCMYSSDEKSGEVCSNLLMKDLLTLLNEAGMSANTYQREAMRTASDKEVGEELLLNGVLGLCGETGEVADVVKKARFQGHDLDKEHIIEELGDVAWYLAVSAEAIGVSLGKVLTKNIVKLRRRYPNGFEENRSINR